MNKFIFNRMTIEVVDDLEGIEYKIVAYDTNGIGYYSALCKDMDEVLSIGMELRNDR